MLIYTPPPIYNKIIEPFAGSARYSLKYFENDVTIIDKDEVIVKVWKYLQQCSPKDILGLPKLEQGMLIDKCGLSEDERLFMGMLAGIASTSPRNKVSKFSAVHFSRKNKMINIANQLYKIKHWKIIHGSYEDIWNEKGMWFIDPPYQFGGEAYIENKIDYVLLAKWCKSRIGQTIVCEQTKATWLDFKPINLMRGANGIKNIEGIWSNMQTNFDYTQQLLF